MCPSCADGFAQPLGAFHPKRSPAPVRAGFGAATFGKKLLYVPCVIALAALAACSSTPTDVPPRAAESESVRAPVAGTADNAEVTDPTAAVAENPVPAEAMEQFDRAVVLMTSGDAAVAEQALRGLATAYPDYAGPMLNLGLLHAKAGRLDEAEKAFKSAIERNPNSAPAFNHLGIVHRRQGRFAEADAAYQQALKADPGYANAYLNLGVLCDLYLQQPERALEAFERYLQVATTPDAKVSTWVSELKARLGSQQRSAGTE